ncbi:MAG TPA: hypothetical protein ENN76_02035, partial [Euryarchaeota archaeon]|nr:hypothetical protein [Euryarchaeota archaeon]
MERCILCGRDYESGERCPVCGFEREKHIFNDIRDAKDGDPLRLDEGTREALDKRNKIMLSYILSIDASSAPQEQVDSTVTEALRQLSIPTYVPLGKELSMNESERALLMAIGDKMDELDLARGGVCGRCETYVRLANGEYSIKE